MLDPSTRPALSLVAMLRVLADHRVDWVLTGSTALAVYGADLVPADLDVTPALDDDNLARLAAALTAAAAIPAFTEGWRSDFTRETCRSWRPVPATEQQLEYLYVTRYGMLDLPMRMCGTYDELISTATGVDVGGVQVTVCDPLVVLDQVKLLASPKHQQRTATYTSLGRLLLGSREPIGVQRLLDLLT